jgi:hypothetical protein
MCAANDSKDSLVERITNWLEGQGYPLEMMTASALRKVGLWVRQSTHYVDVESGKSREIDVLATDSDHYGMSEIHFVIECKASKKPWVLFTSQDTLNNFNRIFALGMLSQKAIGAINNRFYEAVSVLRWFDKEGRTGYNLASAFSDGEDAAFGAALSAVKASLSLLPAERATHPTLVFVFPAIVIGAPLFECYLDEAGDLKVGEIEAGWLFFGARIPKFRPTCIRVVSQKGLAGFASEVGEISRKLKEFIKPDVEREWDTFKSQHPV